MNAVCDIYKMGLKRLNVKKMGFPLLFLACPFSFSFFLFFSFSSSSLCVYIGFDTISDMSSVKCENYWIDHRDFILA